MWWNSFKLQLYECTFLGILITCYLLKRKGKILWIWKKSILQLWTKVWALSTKVQRFPKNSTIPNSGPPTVCLSPQSPKSSGIPLPLAKLIKFGDVKLFGGHFGFCIRTRLGIWNFYILCYILHIPGRHFSTGFSYINETPNKLSRQSNNNLEYV